MLAAAALKGIAATCRMTVAVVVVKTVVVVVTVGNVTATFAAMAMEEAGKETSASVLSFEGRGQAG